LTDEEASNHNLYQCKRDKRIWMSGSGYHRELLLVIVFLIWLSRLFQERPVSTIH